MKITIDAPDGPEPDGSWRMTDVEFEHRGRRYSFRAMTVDTRDTPSVRIDNRRRLPPILTYDDSLGVGISPAFPPDLNWKLTGGGPIVGDVSITRLPPEAGD